MSSEEREAGKYWIERQFAELGRNSGQKVILTWLPESNDSKPDSETASIEVNGRTVTATFDNEDIEDLIKSEKTQSLMESRLRILLGQPF